MTFCTSQGCQVWRGTLFWKVDMAWQARTLFGTPRKQQRSTRRGSQSNGKCRYCSVAGGMHGGLGSGKREQRGGLELATPKGPVAATQLIQAWLACGEV